MASSKRVAILFLFCLPTLLSKACLNSSDCDNKSNTTPLSRLFCIDNVCRTLVRPGFYCKTSQECASYFFHGEDACSAECSLETICESEKNPLIQVSSKCCKGIEEDDRCLPPPIRPKLLSGCSPGLKCINYDGKYKCSRPENNLWILGLFLSLFGGIIANLGVNIQKLAYSQPSAVHDFNMKIWRAGFLLYLVGKVGVIAAYSFGAQSLLAPLGSIQLIANGVFAYLINKEKYTWKDAISTLLIMAGSILAVFFSNRNQSYLSLCEIMKLYEGTKTITWFSILSLLIVATYLYIKIIEINGPFHPKVLEFSVFSKYDRLFRVADLQYSKDSKHVKYGLAFSYSFIGALFGSFATLFSKSVMEFIDKTALGDNQFVYPLTYLFIFLLLLTICAQILWLNRALKHFESLLIIPMFHVFWLSFSLITAGIYFDEFSRYSILQILPFVAGIFLIYGGTILIAFRLRTEKLPKEGEAFKATS